MTGFCKQFFLNQSDEDSIHLYLNLIRCSSKPAYLFKKLLRGRKGKTGFALVPIFSRSDSYRLVLSEGKPFSQREQCLIFFACVQIYSPEVQIMHRIIRLLGQGIITEFQGFINLTSFCSYAV